MFRSLETESVNESVNESGNDISAKALAEIMNTNNMVNAKKLESSAEAIINFENNQFAVVNSASYEQGGISRGSLATAFSAGGLSLSDTTATASTQQLTFSLGGVSVNFKDAFGNRVPAKLFSVSPQQVNFEVPEGADADSNGKTTIEITYVDKQGRVATRYSDVQLKQEAAGIFSALSTGKDAPAAQTTNDGVNFINVSRGAGDNLGIQVDAGTSVKPNYLVLYGTGFRHAPEGSVKAVIGGVECPVTYAGKQEGNVGLDQINLKLDPRLAGANGGQPVDVVITVNGVPTNTTKIRFK